MFIGQSTLEAWLDSGHADLLDGEVLLKRANRAYRLDPAVRFLATISGSDSALLGKVLGEARVVELGGEILGDSVLFGDAAFQIEPGFIGTLVTELSEEDESGRI